MKQYSLSIPGHLKPEVTLVLPGQSAMWEEGNAMIRGRWTFQGSYVSFQRLLLPGGLPPSSIPSHLPSGPHQSVHTSPEQAASLRATQAGVPQESIFSKMRYQN